jgi:hypothetical protein
MITDNFYKLDDISEEYFALQPKVARRKAALGTLPVPAFRLNNTRRGPLFVTKDALNTYVDSRINDAVKLHRQMSLC